MNAASLRALLLGLALASVSSSAGCDDELKSDLGAPVDLLGADLSVALPDLSSCPAPVWNGFPGESDAERRLDCTGCGCTIDPLVATAQSGLWARTLVSASLADTGGGLEISADGSQGPAFASLGSINPGGDFFLDGDFDLRLDYELGQPVPGGKLSLRVDVLAGTFWEVARTRPVDAPLGDFDAYLGSLGGVALSRPTVATTGTLRLVRSGYALTAYADGVELGKVTGGAAGRMAIYLSGGVLGCDVTAAAHADGGSGCALRATLRNLRLERGTLVDRR